MGDHEVPPHAGHASGPISKQTSQSAQSATRASGKYTRAADIWRRERMARPRGKLDAT